MRSGPIVVVVDRSSALELALAALEDLRLRVRVIPTLPEAERALLGAHRPRVSAVLVGLTRDPERGLRLIRALRSEPGLGTAPIAVWAPAASSHLLQEAYGSGASSGILLDGTDEDPIRLARVVHYWAVANEPYAHEVHA